MTLAQGEAPQRSPWLSIWFSPRSTIERIVASNPRRHVLLLAGLGTTSTFVAALIDRGSTIELFDWRVIALIALGGATFGIANLYIAGLFLKWGGRMLGGRASAVEMRAVFAWGYAQSVVGLVIFVIALTGLALYRGADGPRPESSMLVIALPVVWQVLGLWALVATMLMLGRVQRFGFWRTTLCFILGYLGSVLLLLLLLAFRTFLFQPFNIPSGAQKPTFFVGDYIFVSKYPYGYGPYSLPFSPPRLFSGRIFASEPRLGDVVVFRLPRDPSSDYIKRIVGLPGDAVQMIRGVLHINGEPVRRERIADFTETEGTRTARTKQWRETLPNGVSYATLDLVDNGFYDNTPVYQVPAGHYFMMGDNRDNSTDSRVRPENGGVGYVPFENLVGRAEIIFFSINRDAPNQPTVRFDRIGTIVR